MSYKNPIIAIMYDFDKTLSKSDMQDYGFIPAIGLTPDEFWGKTGEFTKKSGVERILSYMYTMKVLAKEKGIKLTREALNEMGKNIEFFPGVETWFDRINEYGKSKGVKIEHYLISSGTREIVEGCKIAKYFKQMYACEFYFDPETKEPIWPKLAINYTQKTQYIFRISKGATNINDDTKINEHNKHRIPYTNMIYIGDGMTDVPCMQLVKDNRGRSIAIYKRGEKDNMKKLLDAGRINYASYSDYTENSRLDKIMKGIIDNVSTYNKLKAEEEKFFKLESKEK